MCAWLYHKIGRENVENYGNILKPSLTIMVRSWLAMIKEGVIRTPDFEINPVR